MNTVTHVLVVDDNPINREVIQEILDDEYHVSIASDAAEALRCAERSVPQIVLLDVMMPGIDGYALCRMLRDRPQTATARIIMVSAKAMSEDRAAGYSAGADAYLTKPFEEDDLLALVRNIIEPPESMLPTANSSEV